MSWLPGGKNQSLEELMKLGNNVEVAVEPLFFMYPLMITIGGFLAIGLIYLRIWKRGIPLSNMVTLTYIALPAAVIGASFFGKLGGFNYGWQIWNYFMFWRSGMSIFGGMVFGSFAGYIYLRQVSYKLQISIWVYLDCIVPAILIAQALGRWGNLFNHEILGNELSVEELWKIEWLPNWIKFRLYPMYVPDENGISEIVKGYTFHEPLFLYESIANLILFLVIMFLVPFLFKLFSPKPWKKNPHAFPIKGVAISKEELLSIPVQRELDLKTDGSRYWYTKANAWKRAYYLYEADNKLAEQYIIANDDHEKIQEVASMEYENIKGKFRAKIKLTSDKQKIKELKKQRSIALRPYRWDRFKVVNSLTKDSKLLYNLNNPDGYKVMHSGVQASLYLMGYSIIRMSLEHQRTGFDLTFKFSMAANYIFLVTVFLVSIFALVLVQFIAPYKWRQPEWLYEKSY
ncbi:prolipoprotein diacylglyceryl transferase [Spiroplasma sp. TIUS-1]|uniref:prolipoprotein diacylglyceryl transferase n=1 Tax=Spiroplasma sp. TIUS-1 TaxID=216963 RepID=UPI00139943A6|nr:prolipoprotein diacylglyceryl transferase family protein [Spiroplasma sp. TIUS-1]QHX35614.1 prolipoprotein diacylglyceryl transferase [Spiroplasma sp. TIUS-1]